MSTPVVFSYRTPNLGDDIQSLALALQLDPTLESVRYINRDHPESDLPGLPGDAVLHASGWMALRPRHPGFGGLPGVIHSIHLNYKPHTIPDGLLKWLKQATGTLGCRDVWTRWVLRSLDIPAEFVPCPTMTPLAPQIPRSLRRDIVGVDISGVVPSAVRESITATATHTLSREEQHGLDTSQRRQLASEALNRYAKARGVVTSRLHAFLPCVAAGTPVYFVDDNRDTTRFGGYEALIVAERRRFERMLG